MDNVRGHPRICAIHCFVYTTLLIFNSSFSIIHFPLKKMRVRPAALIVEKQHVLLLRYRYGDTDVFALPGGNPDRNETLQQTIARELREELGIEIEFKQDAFHGETLLPQLKEDVLHCIFWVEIIGGLPRLNPQETTALEVVWKPISVLADLKLYPNAGKQIQQYFDSALPFGYVGMFEQEYFG